MLNQEDIQSDVNLKLRNLRTEDFDDIKAIMDEVYQNLGGSWPKKKYVAMLKVFKEGQICIEDNGKVIAAAFSVVVEYDKFGDEHTYDEITGNAYLTTHDPNGDVLYGVAVFVDPNYRNLRLGRRL
jgi:ribosomal protein S18 acetylase RimI-like enzyme